MKSINFDNGVREYALNGDENNTIKVNTTDLNLMNRIKDMEQEMEAIQQEITVADNPTPEFIKAADSKLRKIINSAFDSDVCTPAFGNMNLCSVNSSGELLVVSFLNALVNQIKADVESTKIRPEVQKYLDDVHTSGKF